MQKNSPRLSAADEIVEGFPLPPRRVLRTTVIPVHESCVGPKQPRLLQRILIPKIEMNEVDPAASELVQIAIGHVGNALSAKASRARQRRAFAVVEKPVVQHAVPGVSAGEISDALEDARKRNRSRLRVNRNREDNCRDAFVNDGSATHRSSYDPVARQCLSRLLRTQYIHRLPVEKPPRGQPSGDHGSSQ